ncbi:MAG: cupin domain-containing protein [Anaerolineae bacterium]
MAEQAERQSAQAIVAQSRSVADLIDYREGSIVSRIVLGSKVGSVTLFAFDAGQGLSEHTAPFDALVHVFDGEAEVIIAGKSIAVPAGEMVIMPANQPHAVKANSRFKMILTMIRA